MLKHSVIGPDLNGRFLVVHPIPGTSVMAPVLDCRTQEVADREAEILDRAQDVPDLDVRRRRLFSALEGVI